MVVCVCVLDIDTNTYIDEYNLEWAQEESKIRGSSLYVKYCTKQFTLNRIKRPLIERLNNSIKIKKKTKKNTKRNTILATVHTDTHILKSFVNWQAEIDSIRSTTTHINKKVEIILSLLRLNMNTKHKWNVTSNRMEMSNVNFNFVKEQTLHDRINCFFLFHIRCRIRASLTYSLVY